MNDIPWQFPPDLTEDALQRVLPSPDKNVEAERARLRHAMRSAVFNGGKRLRFHLLLETAFVASRAHKIELDLNGVLPAACAVELIHAYSLVHDDLPAMDDADTRRGKPSCHVEFGEATAILVGDALLTLAFEAMTQVPPERSTPALRATAIIARAAGECGMVGGQMIDIAWSNEKENGGVISTPKSGEELLQMHALKTGALIRAACEAGGVLGEGDAQAARAVRVWPRRGSPSAVGICKRTVARDGHPAHRSRGQRHTRGAA